MVPPQHVNPKDRSLKTSHSWCSQVSPHREKPFHVTVQHMNKAEPCASAPHPPSSQLCCDVRRRNCWHHSRARKRCKWDGEERRKHKQADEKKPESCKSAAKRASLTASSPAEQVSARWGRTLQPNKGFISPASSSSYRPRPLWPRVNSSQADGETGRSCRGCGWSRPGQKALGLADLRTNRRWNAGQVSFLDITTFCETSTWSGCLALL